MTKAEIQAVLFVAVSMLAGAFVLLVKQYDSDFLPDLGPVPADARLNAGGRTGAASAGTGTNAGGRTGAASAGGIDRPGTDPAGSGRPSEPAGPTGKLQVPVNSAPASELQKLPGIGPKLAEAIIAYREQSGPFASVEQLLDVKGIGPAKLGRLRPFVTLK